MAGWALFAATAVAAFALLWWRGFPRPLINFALAAVMLAAAGYAWQGHPAWPGRSASAGARTFALDEGTLALRNAMFGRFGPTATYFTAADAMLRYGEPAAAAKLLQGGINGDPDNAALWTQLGYVIAATDHAASPAARFAFARAMRIAPRDPGPPFFLGLALVRSGDFGEARRAWARADGLTPLGAPYRQDIAMRLALLDRFLALKR